MTAKLQGFLGIELYTDVGNGTPSPSFILSGPTGSLRRNEAGETLGDGIYAFYPAVAIEEAEQTLNYSLPEIADSEGSRD